VLITLLKSKIHRATVTQTELGYVGSITIDSLLLAAADLRSYEKVLVVDVDNGSRLETYCIAGKAGSGQVCLNGAAARLVSKGDKIIVMSFVLMNPEEAQTFVPKVVFVTPENSISSVVTEETHGPSPETSPKG
jgi:aspartate 1-decarboxylase